MSVPIRRGTAKRLGLRHSRRIRVMVTGVQCDICKTVVEAPDGPPEGWQCDKEGDFCPKCIEPKPLQLRPIPEDEIGGWMDRLMAVGPIPGSAAWRQEREGTWTIDRSGRQKP